MKISLNWLKEYIELTETPEEISDLLTQSGLEVEGLEKIQGVPGGLEGLLVGEVLSCEKHPDADRLNCTTIDVGAAEPLSVVCGASNVEVGIKVVVAPVNAFVHPVKGEPFKIKKSKIRGQLSEGMICAEDEIGLGTDHDGIMVLDADAKNGGLVKDHLDLQDDFIIEIGLTPNRGDAISHIGVARDLKAMLNREVKWPKLANLDAGKGHPIKLSVENEEACPRYSGVYLEDITVADSPEWLQSKLIAIGLTPINNIVDVTNFVCHELGQPMHAFDADQISDHTVIVKCLDEGSKFVTLDEKERSLKAEDLMICDSKGGMCIAGVFGGINSGVTKKTSKVFLEAAYFSASFIRKTSQVHGLKTDASFRYERGTDPRMTVKALQRAVHLMNELAGAKVASAVYDLYPNKVADKEIPMLYAHIDRLIGQIIERDRIKEILTALDIQVQDETEQGFLAIVPPYRVDVTRESDVTEEILRIFGYNNIELTGNLGSEYLAEKPKSDQSNRRKTISEQLAGRGYAEIITNSLTKEAYAEINPTVDSAKNVQVLNKLSEDLGVLRQDIMFNGLEVLVHNINRQQKDLKIFEFGQQYFLTGERTFGQKTSLDLLITGSKMAESWLQPSEKVSFHDLKTEVFNVLHRLGFKKIEAKPIHEGVYQYGMALFIHKKPVGSIGELTVPILKKLGIKQEVFHAKLDWDQLLNLNKKKLEFAEISKFPAVRRDLSLVVEQKVSFGEILKIAQIKGGKLLKDVNVFDVYQGDRIDANKKAYALSFTLQDTEKTLNDKLIDKTMSNLMSSFQQSLGAIIRQ